MNFFVGAWSSEITTIWLLVVTCVSFMILCVLLIFVVICMMWKHRRRKKRNPESKFQSPEKSENITHCEDSDSEGINPDIIPAHKGIVNTGLLDL